MVKDGGVSEPEKGDTGDSLKMCLNCNENKELRFL
jgi:hypothetical protein